MLKKKISDFASRFYCDIFQFDKKTIKFLKERADKSKNKSYRILFHKNNYHLTHEMMICFKKNAVVPVHKHPNGRSESYHIIEGSMNVYFFKDSGKPLGYIKLSDFKGAAKQAPKTLEAIKNQNCGWFFRVSTNNLRNISEFRIAYWVDINFMDIFATRDDLDKICPPRVGTMTTNNERFLRYWWEVSNNIIEFNCDSL